MIGFIDDDPRKSRARIQGYHVLGGFESLRLLVISGAVDTIVISTRVMDATRLQMLQELCSAHQVDLAKMHFELHAVS
jgi:FlaA1/EpsC-like NDP-sugar epimerase